jgi:hypothetical protein
MLDGLGVPALAEPRVVMPPRPLRHPGQGWIQDWLALPVQAQIWTWVPGVVE